MMRSNRKAEGDRSDSLDAVKEDNDEESDSLPQVIRNGPRITAEVERLELARVSDCERAKAHADLYGLPPPGSAYRDRLLAERDTVAVEAALCEIPPVERVALLRAQLAFPFLLSSPTHVTPFLVAEGGDARRAAFRIVRYWENRERLLGDDAFKTDSFGTRALTDEDRGRLYSRGFRPTSDPKVDTALRESVVRSLAEWLLGKIEAIEREIDAMPLRKKSALLDVRQRQPDVIDEEHMILFLKSEDYDPCRAAKRMASFWDMKCYLFGREGSLDGDEDVCAFAEECREELEEGIMYMLPDVDAFGRGLLMIRADKCPVAKAAQKRLLKVLWFCIKEAMDDKRIRENGLVYICYIGSFSQTQASNLEFLSRLSQLVFHCIPLRICAFHDCFPPGGRWFRIIFLPFLKWLMSRSGRMRRILHDGEMDEVLSSLKGCGIRKEQLPGVLGGSLDEEYEGAGRRWLVERQQEERT